MRRHVAAVLALVASLLGCGGGQEALETAPAAPLPSPAGGVVSGVVTLEDSDNPTGIMVYCAGTNQVAFTDGEGRYTFLALPFGDYDLMARKEGYSERALGQVHLAAQQPTATVGDAVLSRTPLDVINLPLPSRGGLSGQVRLAGRTDSGGVTVRLEGTSISAQTDTSGAWTLDEVVPGDYNLRFEAAGFGGVTARATALPNQVVEVPATTLQPSTGEMGPAGSASIAGVVAMLGPDGHMVDDYAAALAVLEGTDRTAAPDAEGYFEFRGLEPNETYRLSARAPGYRVAEAQELTPRPGEQVNATVFLESTEVQRVPTGSLAGRIELSGGESPAGAQIGVAGTSLTAVAGADGVFSLEAIPEGAVTLIAQASRYDVLEVPDVDIRAGETTDVGTLTLTVHREPPRVIATTPAANARAVTLAPQVPVFIRFSADMDMNSAKAAVEIDPPVPFEAFMGGERSDTDEDLLLLLVRGGEDGLHFRQRVNVTIGTGARSAEGVPMREAHEFRFSMGPPSLYGSVPRDGEEAFVSDQDILLYFNAAMRSDEIAPLFSFSPDPPTIPNIFCEIDPGTGWTVVRIQGRLEPNQRYRLRLSRNLRTVAGQALGGSRELSFRTAPLPGVDHFGRPREQGDSVLY